MKRTSLKDWIEKYRYKEVPAVTIKVFPTKKEAQEASDKLKPTFGKNKMNPPKETRTAHYCPYYGNVLLEFHSNEQGKGCNCADIEYVVALDEPKGITAEEHNKRVNRLQPDTGAHYRFQLIQLVAEVDLQRGYVVINLDPYRIADVYGITNHAIFSALKKLLVAGGRGFKDTAQDIADSIGALQRWQEMQEEKAALANEVGKSLKIQETFVAPAVCTTIDRGKESLVNLRAMQADFGNPVESMPLDDVLKINRLVNYE